MGFSRVLALTLCLGLSAACTDQLHDFERNPSDHPGGETLNPEPANQAPIVPLGTVAALSDGELAAVIGISLRAGMNASALAASRSSVSEEVRAMADRITAADTRTRAAATALFDRLGVVELEGPGSRSFAQLAGQTTAFFNEASDERASAMFLDNAINMNERALELLEPVEPSQGTNGGGATMVPGNNVPNGGGNNGGGNNGTGGNTGTSTSGRDGGVNTGNSGDSGLPGTGGGGDSGLPGTGNGGDSGLPGTGNSADSGLPGTGGGGDSGLPGTGSGGDAGNGSGSDAGIGTGNGGDGGVSTGNNGNGNNGNGNNGNGNGGSVPTADQVARSSQSTSDSGELKLFLDFFRAELEARIAEARLIRAGLED